MQNTVLYSDKDKDKLTTEIMDLVYRALSEKGYNPVNQIVGYILSGDPTYITGHMGARSQITKIERDELLEAIVKTYLESLGKNA